jgi:ATP-dependent protease Clp ATPase subunit
MFTHTAVKEIARVALSRGVGARGLRSVVEEVMEGVLDDPEAEDRAAEDILRVAESVPGKDLAYGVCSIRGEHDMNHMHHEHGSNADRAITVGRTSQ